MSVQQVLYARTVFAWVAANRDSPAVLVNVLTCRRARRTAGSVGMSVLQITPLVITAGAVGTHPVPIPALLLPRPACRTGGTLFSAVTGSVRYIRPVGNQKD